MRRNASCVRLRDCVCVRRCRCDDATTVVPWGRSYGPWRATCPADGHGLDRRRKVRDDRMLELFKMFVFLWSAVSVG